MEIKIYYTDGVVESHTIPPLAGTTRSQSGGGYDFSRASIDDVADVVERVRASEEGVTLERHLRVNRPGDRTQRPGTFSSNGTAGMVIVPAERMADVRLVTCDNERIWPEPDENEGEGLGDIDIERLEELVRRVS